MENEPQGNSTASNVILNNIETQVRYVTDLTIEYLRNEYVYGFNASDFTITYEPRSRQTFDNRTEDLPDENF